MTTRSGTSSSGTPRTFRNIYANIFRELLDQGYVIVSPEYRGSVGHGSELYEQIDYGGAEIDDVHDARNWAVENPPNVDRSSGRQDVTPY